MVIYLGSLFQVCCGKGGTLQTNITDMCGECSQCLGHTGFAPTHGLCAFLVYTAQAPGSLQGNCLKQALGCVHFPGLSHSGSGSWVLHKGTDLVGPVFCAIHRSEQLRRPGAWRAHSPRWAMHLIISLVPVPQFPGCTSRVTSQVCSVSPLGS